MENSKYEIIRKEKIENIKKISENIAHKKSPLFPKSF